MTVRYSVRRGHPVPDYLCQRRGIETAEPSCQIIPGTGLDEAVSRVVLEAVTPAALEVALEVFDELRRRKAEVDRLRRAQVERAREDAELAQRQFMLVRPEHRLVADTLEQQWNEKLARLAALEDDYARVTTTDGAELSGHDHERIQALVADLPRVWHDPRTPARERKRMLRLLIEDVTLLRDRTIQLHIRWKGGATTSLECPIPRGAPDLRRTPATIVEMVRALTPEQTDRQIADTLNGRWLRTGTGQLFTRLRVRHARDAHRIPVSPNISTGLDGSPSPTSPPNSACITRRPSASRAKACFVRCASTTMTPFSLSRRLVHCPVPTRANASATVGSILSVHRANGRNCNMKPDACDRDRRRGRAARPRRSARARRDRAD